MALTPMPDFTFKHMEQPDKLVDSPAANKEKFDSRGNEIRNYINSSLVPEINNKNASSIPITDAGGNFTATNVEGALEELFTSVSDGKTQVAAAITDKGVPASGSDTFPQLANKIGEINTGVTPAGTAVVGDVLTGKTFINSTGATLTGTMPNRGAANITPGPAAQTIQAGYHNGNGQVAAVTFDASKVLTGTTIAGTAGTMPNRGTVNITPSTANQTIQAGYHSGSGVVAGSANLIAGNIKSGVNIFGVVGTLSSRKTIVSRGRVSVPLVAGYGQNDGYTRVVNFSAYEDADSITPCILIRTSGTSSSRGLGFVTDSPIDLTGFSKIICAARKWESKETQNQTSIYVVVSTNKGANYDTYNARVSGFAHILKWEELDISSLNGSFYIRVHNIPEGPGEKYVPVYDLWLE